VYVLKRPYVDEFLERMGQLYECVLFTASLAKVKKMSLQRIAPMISRLRVQSPAPADSQDSCLPVPLIRVRGGLVSRSSPKKPRSRSIFKALFCCLSAQNVSRPGSPCEAPTQKEEAQSTPKADLLQCLQYQFYQIPGTSLLPEVAPKDKGKICMVIDLDETLVHSSFKYADPVTDLLDREGVFSSRLFREACVFHQGCYVKDLSRLGRDLKKTIILDNSPASYIFHPENAVPVQSWFDDLGDTELLSLIPIFEELSDTEDIYTSLGQLRAP
ncbi:hypothetical protein AB205_0119380, partial [Aquarana catesbeiana]